MAPFQLKKCASTKKLPGFPVKFCTQESLPPDRRIESWVQRQIADLGTARIAEVAGINKSTVSRWRENLVPNMSLLLAILISNRDGVKGDFEA
ncbi:MAG: CII family transcriptional regulator [Enterococcus faecalis]|nr:CII family transcriptional regulator [Enterococcus faecalis]